MTLLDDTIRDGKRMASNARSAGDNAVHGGEMLRASSDVINARLTIMAQAMANPMKADMAEMSLMGTEKMQAMAASATAVASDLGELAARVSKSAMEEIGYAQSAAALISSAASPQAAATAQYNYAVGWWSRATSQMLTLNTELLKAQADALKPIHSAAMANAKRLKR